LEHPKLLESFCEADLGFALQARQIQIGVLRRLPKKIGEKKCALA
tara:strand:- start:311 stop:445 length:135 start_codon:yes stop_codon:yes gene_type:complete